MINNYKINLKQFRTQILLQTTKVIFLKDKLCCKQNFCHLSQNHASCSGESHTVMPSTCVSKTFILIC